MKYIMALKVVFIFLVKDGVLSNKITFIRIIWRASKFELDQIQLFAAIKFTTAITEVFTWYGFKFLAFGRFIFNHSVLVNVLVKVML